MLELIEKHRGELTSLCRKYGVERLGIFGSALRNDFDDKKSDLDFLVEYHDLTIADAADRYLGLLVDLEDLFNRSIDLVSYRAIRNPYFKEVVDKTQVQLYAA
jgi:uncharacterized protein